MHMSMALNADHYSAGWLKYTGHCPLIMLASVLWPFLQMEFNPDIATPLGFNGGLAKLGLTSWGPFY